MAKIKIHELAKELELQSKDIVSFLKEKGSDVKNHMSNIEESEISMVRGHFKKGDTQMKQETVQKPQNETSTKRMEDTPIERKAENQNKGHQIEESNSERKQENLVEKNMQNQENQNKKQNQDGETKNGNGQDGNRSSSQGSNQSGERKNGGSQYTNRSNSQGNGQYRNRSNSQGNNQGGQYGNRSNNQGSQGNGQYGNRSNNQGGQGSGQYGNRSNNQGGQGNGQYGNRSNNQGGQGSGQYGNRSNNQSGQGSSQYGNRSNNQGSQGNGQYGNRSNNQGGQGSSQYGNRSNNQSGQGNGQYGNRSNNQGGQGSSQYGNRSNGQGSGQYGNRSNGQGSGQYGNRPNSQGGQGSGQYGNRSNGQGSGQYGNRSNNQGGQGNGQYGNRSGGQGQRAGGGRGGYSSGRGFDKDSFDKDKDSGYNNRGFQNRRGDAKSGEKSSIKSDLANELTKEQRAAAFNDRNRDKNRERGRDRDEMDETTKSLKGKKDPNRKGAFIMPKPKTVEEQKEDEIKTITIPEVLTIQELADKMKKTASTVVKKLFLEGKIVTINQEITYEEAEEIALEFNCIVEKEVQVDIVEEILKEEEEDESLMVKRPPVVCVMGHVDHGKTSLLDAIRETNVTEREAGGITQHIGAYVVEINGEKITFLDTPGHEAFTSMRMRGAQSTDIAILVVAADDGVMPQTIEAISHAKAAGVQIIVAINKIDKPSANIERVKQELTEHELVAEDWGGDTVFVPVSAHTKEGIPSLLEMILLTAEVQELKANPNRKARGIVIEAQLDKGRGTVATILVQKGTLHVGDNIAVGSAYGKVRAMMDDKGRKVKEAAPSTPVEILGLNEVPNAGEIFIATDNEKEARNIAETFIKQGREKLLADTKAKLSLDGLFSQIKAGNIKELNIIVKADVQGSVEAVRQSLMKLTNEEVAVRIVHGGVGAINESDVTLAATSNAIIIGFNVRPDNTAREIAEREKVDLRMYRVIYDAIADVEAAMKGLLDPTFEEKIIGHAEVRQIFKASGLGVIAGSYVLDGKIVRGCSTRITRNGDLIFEGELASLKRFKDDVKEVASGYECGLVFEKFNDLQEFDQVELYMMVEVPR